MTQLEKTMEMILERQETKNKQSLDNENANSDYLEVRLGKVRIQIDFLLKTVDVFSLANEATIHLSDDRIIEIKTQGVEI